MLYSSIALQKQGGDIQTAQCIYVASRSIGRTCAPRAEKGHSNQDPIRRVAKIGGSVQIGYRGTVVAGNIGSNQPEWRLLSARCRHLLRLRRKPHNHSLMMLTVVDHVAHQFLAIREGQSLRLENLTGAMTKLHIKSRVPRAAGSSHLKFAWNQG